MKRLSNVDILKLISIYFVVSIHFFNYSGYYNDVSISAFGILQTILRSFVYCGVTLFIITTGYLQYQKKPSKKYFLSLARIMILYGIACVTRVIYLYVMKADISIIVIIKQILNFEFVNYSWYINMFIGLFLFIPFLNIILDSFSKKQFYFFIIGFSLFIGVPSYVNMIGHVIVNSQTANLIPVWWYNLYPVFYYFIGAGIRKFEINLSVKKSLCFIFIGCSLDLIGCMIAVYYNHSIFVVSDYSAISTMLISIALATSVLNCKKLKIIKLPKLAENASNATLATLLCFGYIDAEVYQWFRISLDNRLLYFVPITVLIWMIGNVLGLVMNYISNYIYKKIAYFEKMKG